MKPLLLLITTALCAFFCGCSSTPKGHPDMRYSAYAGADYLEWETSSGALADMSYDLPVYRGWPNRPYAVVGDVRHKDPQRRWREEEIRRAIRTARAHHGEAIIIRLTSESGVGAVTGTLGPVGATRGVSGLRAETTALVIRWQTPEEIQMRRTARERLEKQLIAAQPNLEASSDTAGLVIRYLLQSGIRHNEQEFISQAERLMSRVSATAPNDLSGQWVFKATITERRLAGSSDDGFTGVASVRSVEENVAIVSLEALGEISFSGVLNQGRLTGQLGVGGYSAKAEGVALDDKISLTFQTTTASGTVLGTVVLQRNTLRRDSKPQPQLL